MKQIIILNNHELEKPGKLRLKLNSKPETTLGLKSSTPVF